VSVARQGRAGLPFNILLYYCSLAFRRNLDDTQQSLLVIQCDSGHLNADLIACARYRIYDKRVEASRQNEWEGQTHVLFIIHLPRHVLGSSFVGFQGNPWISTHIDVLRTSMIALHKTMGVPISHLFFGKVAANRGREEEERGLEMSTFTDRLKESDEAKVMQAEGSPSSFEVGFSQEELRPKPPQLEQVKMDTSVEGGISHKEAKADAPEFTAESDMQMPGRQTLLEVPSGVEFENQPPEDNYLHTQFRRLHGCIQPAASKLQDSSTNKERTTKRVAILVSLIPRNPSFSLGMQSLNALFCEYSYNIVLFELHLFGQLNCAMSVHFSLISRPPLDLGIVDSDYTFRLFYR